MATCTCACPCLCFCPANQPDLGCQVLCAAARKTKPCTCPTDSEIDAAIEAATANLQGGNR